MDSEKSTFENLLGNPYHETENDSFDDNDSDWYDCTELDSFDEEIIHQCSERVFCFETDYVALKGNTDYLNLIRALTVLEIQRIKTVQDIEKLEDLRRKIKSNPREYLNKLIKGDNSDIPSNIQVLEVPNIDWSKYSRKNHTTESVPCIINKPLDNEDNKVQKQVEKTSSGDENNTSVIVRGRIFDQTKPQTFNQLWTAEEQLRLEELLLEFPPETNENNRWRKIAHALGNRTTKQVCSRVQKYFKKLNQAGLPIPGHQLKSNNMTSLKKKPRRLKKPTIKDSTFFPTQHLGDLEQLDNVDEEETRTRIPAITHTVKADILKKVIEMKRKDAALPPFSHPGIQCAVCAEIPIKGTRWHCLVCQSVSICSDCVISQLHEENAIHHPSHPLEPIANPIVAYWDPDYMPDSFKSTNYLDPNFVTAT